jgi:hypothetical protein
MYSGLQHESCAPRPLSCVNPLGAKTEEPQRRDERSEMSVGESAQTRFPTNDWLDLGPRDP